MPNPEDTIPVATFALHSHRPSAPSLAAPTALPGSHFVDSDAIPDLRLRIEVRSAAAADAVRAQLAGGRLRLAVGDASESTGFDLQVSYTNLVQIEIDVARRSVTLRASLVGLPPVYLMRSGEAFALTTPLPPVNVPGLDAGGLDFEACADLLRWGHPIDGRTLAKNLRVLEAGARIEAAAGGVRVIAQPFPEDASLFGASREQLLREMCAEFAAHARRMDANGAVVSLSGGLDSRAAGVAMLNAGHDVSFATLAVGERSLDAKLARAFCAAYGARHQLVVLDDRVLQGLPARLERTAALTYGVSVLSQTIDLFMYDTLGGIEKRVTGNLGNQVGRGGVESTAAYRPAIDIFSPAVRAALDSRPIEPWYLDRMNRDGFARVLFQQEVSFWSVPNYTVGARHAVQQCPYASRRLIVLGGDVR